MIISEEPYACGLAREDGGYFRFDDIGCLLNFLGTKKPLNTRSWVRDFPGGEWVPADQAHFLISNSQFTPMGYGIIAFKDEEAAKAAFSGLRNEGNLLHYKELKNNWVK